MLYMNTSDVRNAFNFTYLTPDDKVQQRLSLQVLERQGRRRWRQVNTFNTDPLLFALRENGRLRLADARN